jgi:membrane-associated phospholipid phosphatase
MHFLSDVLAGALLGSALGVASIVAFASYGLL